MSDYTAEEEAAMLLADRLTMTGTSDLAADDEARTLIRSIKADAWDEGAEYAWQATGEGHNSEYVEHYGTHDGELRFVHANGDHNPYRENT